MMKLIPKTVSRKVARQILKGKKNSPHIFFAAGVAGAVGSTVLACRATLKLETLLDEVQADVSNAKEAGVLLLANDTVDYDEKDHYRDLGIVYVRNAVKVGRLYAPAALVGAASIAALTGSHIQLTRRNTALTATIGMMTKAYDEYRMRVRDVVGEERELEIHRGIIRENEIIEGKKGEVLVIGPTGSSMYARCFDETNPNWHKDAEYNKTFLMVQQNVFNNKLATRGHVFLNEIYDELGFERTKAGAVVGWVINGEGDNYIDFGMFETKNANFVNGYERSVWLDFNVDGIVYDKI